MDLNSVIQAIEDFKTNYQPLLTKMDNMLDKWGLEDYLLDNEPSGFNDNVTDNEPRVFANALLYTLSAARMNIVIHREDGDKDKDYNMEKWGFSVFKANDARLRRRGQKKLQQAEGFLGAIRGGMVARCLFYEKDGQLIPDIRHYDPRHLAFGMGDDGPVWTAYTTYRDPYAIEAQYGKQYIPIVKDSDKSTGEIKVTEYWDAEKWAVFLNDEPVPAPDGKNKGKVERKHDIGRVPVVLVPIGSNPLIVGESGRFDHVKYWFETIYDASAGMIENRSKLWSIWMSLAHLAKDPRGIAYLRDVSRKLNVPFETKGTTNLYLDERYEPLHPPDIAGSVPILFSEFSKALQKADFPDLRYAQTWKGQEWSGTALETALEGPERVLNPILEGFESLYPEMYNLMLDQWRMHRKKWRGTGYDNRGQYFQQVFALDDVKGNYDLEIRFMAITPEKNRDNIFTARELKNNALASDEYIDNEVLQFKDVQGEHENRIMQEMENNIPALKILKAIEIQTKKGNTRQVEILEQEYQRMTAPPPQGGEMMPPNAPPEGVPLPPQEIVNRLQSMEQGNVSRAV